MEKSMFNLADFQRECGCDCRTRNNTGGCLVENNAASDRCDGALTMVFINMQPLDSVYDHADAFKAGTLFLELNKPFNGGMRR